MANINRRRFLGASALGFMSGAGLLGAMNAQRAFAADTTGYKALVCIFLKGGLDHADTVLPRDAASYDQLRSHRTNLMNSYGAARSRDSLLPLTPDNAAQFGGRQFGLPNELGPLHTLFQDRELAIVGNVGPLIEPVTRSQMEANSVATPPRLFSHNDQQSTWMALGVEGARYGWGGLFADAALASSPSDNPQFAAITASTNDVFLAGQVARPFKASQSGPPFVRLLEESYRLGNNAGGEAAREGLRAYLTAQRFSDPNLFMRDVSASTARAVENAGVFRTAYEDSIGVSTAFPGTDTGGQLQAVAQTIAIQQQLGASRQVFYVAKGGFDTHDNQHSSLPGIQQEIADAMAAFRTAMLELGMWDNVTVFTASDFGRTVIDNGDGTDHGWGGHQFVMGGAVNGGVIYGDMPDFDVNAEHYTPSRGRLIPSVSVEQYAATLGAWFGLDAGELNGVLPNLRNFDDRNLGFV